MSEERITRWFAVDADGRVIARFTRENDADSYVAMTTLRVVKLMEVRHTESIVDTAELSALREKAEGPIVEAPRPFKVGDRVGTTYADKGTIILAVKWDEDGEVCEPNWHKLKLLAPAPAPEATAALGGAITQKMVPESWLDDAVKKCDEYRARAEKATADYQAAHAEIANLRKALAALSEISASDSKEREAVRAENTELRKMLDGEWKDDERARFERECAMRLLAALVTRGAPHIGQKETEPLLSLAKQMADHYLPAKEQGK